MKSILITGASSGLGEALAKEYLLRGDSVYAIGKNIPKTLENHQHFFFFNYDLSETFMLRATLKDFFKNRSFETVILNAGVLGNINTLSNSGLIDVKAVMEINLWANKEIIDALAESTFVKQIVGISSGASINGSKGWGAYSLSKAGLNMLLNVYAKELPEIHFTALAPGIINTKMVKHIMDKVDDKMYPSIKKIRSGDIQTPRKSAKRLIKLFPKLLEYESGSFLDVREID